MPNAAISYAHNGSENRRGVDHRHEVAAQMLALVRSGATPAATVISQMPVDTQTVLTAS
jgi:hypothetical protein